MNYLQIEMGQFKVMNFRGQLSLYLIRGGSRSGMTRAKQYFIKYL